MHSFTANSRSCLQAGAGGEAAAVAIAKQRAASAQHTLGESFIEHVGPLVCKRVVLLCSLEFVWGCVVSKHPTL